MECDNCGEIDTVLFDGYRFGGRLLESVMFRVFYQEGLPVKVEPVDGWDSWYLSKLNKDKWQKAAEEYAAGLDDGECPKCGEDIDMSD